MIPIRIPMSVAVNGETIPVNLASRRLQFHVDLDSTYSFTDVPEYEGEYEVTPRLYEQSLETTNKALRNDVTVRQIPVVYTSNLYDGQTVVIG